MAATSRGASDKWKKLEHRASSLSLTVRKHCDLLFREQLFKSLERNVWKILQLPTRNVHVAIVSADSGLAART